MPPKTEPVPGLVRWCPDCRTKNAATPGPSWQCSGCGAVWVRADSTLTLTLTNRAPTHPVSSLLLDTNSCKACGKPRFHHWRVLSPEEWCSCPDTLRARAAIGRWLS